MSRLPIAPRDSKEWNPADEVFFIQCLVKPHRDSHKKGKTCPSLATQLNVSPAKLLTGYLRGLDKRVNWGKKITSSHIEQFRTLAFTLLAELRQQMVA
jgi:hypothetical protein